MSAFLSEYRGSEGVVIEVWGMVQYVLDERQGHASFTRLSFSKIDSRELSFLNFWPPLIDKVSDHRAK